MEENRENCIEWLNGQDTIAVTLNQKRFISRVEQLAKKYPKQVQILARNMDGSVFCHLPLKSLKLNIVERELTDKQREEYASRLKQAKQGKQTIK